MLFLINIKPEIPNSAELHNRIQFHINPAS